MDLFKTFNEIEKRNIRDLLLKIQSILKYDIGENKFFTVESLATLLNQKKIQFTKEDLHVALYTLLNDFGDIIRQDYWEKEPTFQLLDEHYRDTNWQKSYVDLNDDNTYSDKSFLLVSDTHIGNDAIHNFKLINNIYDLAIKNGIKNTFHLGDVFDGINHNDSEGEKELKINEQLELFIKYYPKCKPSEMRTIALLGNHDMKIYGKYNTSAIIDIDDIKPQLYDLRSITKDNPSFIFYPLQMFQIKLNNIPIHFSHQMYLNSLFRTIKIQKLEDITNPMNNTFGNFPLYISGHLHKGLLCVSNDKMGNDQFFVGVPSTSSLNKDNVVAYIVNINNDGDINVTTINSTTDDKVDFGKTYTHTIGDNNKKFKIEF